MHLASDLRFDVHVDEFAPFVHVDVSGAGPVLGVALEYGVLFGGAQLLLALLFAYVLPAGPWTSTPGFSAHQVIALAFMVYVACVGSAAWFDPAAPPSTLLSRCADAHPVGQHLARLILGSQLLWDIPAGLLVPSLRQPAMLAHHVIMCTLSYLALDAPAFLYYAVFYFGVVEISSVPLAVVDTFHPRQKEWTRFAAAHPLVGALSAASRVAFAALYLVMRVLCFPYVMFTGVFADLPRLLALETPPVAPYALITIGAGGLLLTALQLYWGVLVVKQVAKTLGLGATAKAKAS